MDRNKELDGKVAIVTGSARNIGRRTALELADAGAAVVINAVTAKELCEEVAHEVEAAGGKAIPVLADITNQDDVDQMVAATKDAFGGIDILVNNAANRGHNKIVDMPFEEWKEITSIILDGSFLCTRAAVKHMAPNKWGRVIFLGGIGAYLGYPERCHVSTGKMGVVGMMHCLANELAADGITVNVVAPGRIGGERAPSAGEPTGDTPPVGFVGMAPDVGRTIHFLCQPDANFITGQTIHINGGGFLT
ncbi:MAG TPA: short-chain dehydrogenase [Rhodospirillaceae bacterium]|nr:short-chain dehydrogenase [Rhodospirillaceae bacterium]